MSQPSSVVIVGASLTGATAATTLREEGYSGPIILVGDEPHLPYERPPLSKDYLLGKAQRDSAFVHPIEWYQQNNVELRLGVRALSLDVAAHQVHLSDGSALNYGALLLATGSSARHLHLTGSDLSGIRYLRTIEDADRLRDDFASHPKVAVVGGGWIGLETAAAARTHGLDVTVLEASSAPLSRVLGSEVAEIFADLHREHGVDLRTNTRVVDFVGDDGRVTGVELGDGTTVPADIVMVGVGITPNVELAEATGLTFDNGIVVDRGIVVDEYMRTTAPDVWAAGDIANAHHVTAGRRLRVEHWANAQRQGAVAGRSILGQLVPDERLPYFFTDQYDLGMEYVGYVEPDGYDDIVIRGDRATREIVVFWLHAGKVLAGMNVNVWDVSEQIEALIARGTPVDRARLADPTVPLTEL